MPILLSIVNKGHQPYVVHEGSYPQIYRLGQAREWEHRVEHKQYPYQINPKYNFGFVS